MYKLTISGPAGPSNIKDVSKLDGIDCQDCFSEYFHESFKIGDKIYPGEQCLIDKGVRDGYMRFSHKDGVLNVIVEYVSRDLLNDDELLVLKDYTQGQLSDGIGEGFEQNPCMYDGKKEIYLSPWFRGQVLKIEQQNIAGN